MIMRSSRALKTSPQIFFSFPISSKEMAKRVRRELEGAGLTIVVPDLAVPGEVYDDQLRAMLQNSDAMVVVLSELSQRDEIPSSILLEIGAAFGAAKPIFVITKDMSARLPFNTPGLRVLPIGRVEEIAQQLLS
jgi:hypothetical protein